MSKKRFAQPVVTRLRSSLKLRGPDPTGIAELDTVANSGRCGMAVFLNGMPIIHYMTKTDNSSPTHGMRLGITDYALANRSPVEVTTSEMTGYDELI